MCQPTYHSSSVDSDLNQTSTIIHYLINRLQGKSARWKALYVNLLKLFQIVA